MLLIREIFAKTPDEKWNEEFKRLSDSLNEFRLQVNNNFSTSSSYATNAFGTLNQRYGTYFEFETPVIRRLTITDV